MHYKVGWNIDTAALDADVFQMENLASGVLTSQFIKSKPEANRGPNTSRMPVAEITMIVQLRRALWFVPILLFVRDESPVLREAKIFFLYGCIHTASSHVWGYLDGDHSVPALSWSQTSSLVISPFFQ